ncbi:MAG: hypothetical protein OXS40_16345, partial [Gammaproteobacteria bacterium]|nr:hypothetical protein [Gammaproteobacteria bacterium]
LKTCRGSGNNWMGKLTIPTSFCHRPVIRAVVLGIKPSPDADLALDGVENRLHGQPGPAVFGIVLSHGFKHRHCMAIHAQRYVAAELPQHTA